MKKTNFNKPHKGIAGINGSRKLPLGQEVVSKQFPKSQQWMELLSLLFKYRVSPQIFIDLAVSELEDALSGSKTKTVQVKRHYCAIFLPTTVNGKSTLSYSLECKRVLKAAGDGSTTYTPSGDWGEDQEEVWEIKTYMTAKALITHLPEIDSLVSYLQSELNQKSFVVIIDNKFVEQLSKR